MSRTTLVCIGIFMSSVGFSSVCGQEKDKDGYYKLESVKEGKPPVEAKLIELSGTKVKIQLRKASRIMTVDLSRFSEATRKVITENTPKAYPEIKVDMRVGRRRTQKRGSTYFKNQHLAFKFEARNLDRSESVEKAKATLIVVARDMKVHNRYVVLNKQTTTGSLKATKTMGHAFEPFVTSYDDDQNESSNLGGYKYHGYILVFQDEDNEGFPFKGHCSHGGLEKKMLNRDFLAKVLEYKVNEGLTRDFEPEKGSGLKSGAGLDPSES